MKILILLLGCLFSFSAFAQSVKTDSGCLINHPEIHMGEKILRAAVGPRVKWTGSCVNGNAHGYGYYGFHENKNNQAFIYLNAVNGATSSGYAILYTIEKESVYEDLVDLTTGKKVEDSFCKSTPACKKIYIESEKNQGTPPDIDLPLYVETAPPIPSAPPTPPAAPPIPPKAPISCTAKHPTELVWKSPNKSIWTGGCLNGKAQGYGWYKFDLTNDGYDSSRVEVLLEFNNGEVANTFYYVKMFTQEQLTFEGFAQLGGYQIDGKNCLETAECARTADVVKNGVRPPLPPKAPQLPPPQPQQPEVPDETYKGNLDCFGEKVDDIGDPPRHLSEIQSLLVEMQKIGMRCLIHLNEKEYGSDGNASNIVNGLNQFMKYYPTYAHYICQRNGVFVEACEKQQLYMAINIFYDIYASRDIYQTLRDLHGDYRPLGDKCSNAINNGDFNSCWHNQIKNLENFIAQKHPNGAKNGSLAFDGLAKALGYLHAGGGSAYTGEYLDAYEHLMWNLYDTANTVF